ncbi:MAG: orotate phosphoribosyltransferase [Lachnospiraceae bacterium]|uniref:orotate phosphoribosyltransferase n=1 Tax=Parablautia sp. Marseille-Q6255 TaxID=3039593 RepID=UPI0024BCF294|nr:orotate phosphoribosyltransferase [Parablautia sp. Marseille-Q6255]
METKTTKIHSSVNPNAIIRVIPGHFATNHSHINTYVDMTIMKSRKSEAAAAASVLARKYTTSTYIDTIICMDGCEVIGAYLADELTASGIMSLNQHKTMYIVTPEMNPGGQLIFRDNMQFMIEGKHCLLLLASATTGRTVARALECIQYYGGMISGVSAIFSASDMVEGVEINHIFSAADIGNYETYEAAKCPMCARHQKVDAIVNSFGYSRL